MEFYIAVIVFGCCLIWNIVDLIGFKGMGSIFFQTRFILKNKVLKRMVIIKPFKDPRLNYKRQEIPLFKFVPYVVSLILTVIVGLLTLICGINKTANLEKLLTHKAMFISAIIYTALIVLNTIVLTIVDNLMARKEYKLNEKPNSKN